MISAARNRNFIYPLKKIANLKSNVPAKSPYICVTIRSVNGRINTAGVMPELNEHDDLNSWYVNPIIVLPKNDYVKLIIDACYLNSITDTSNSSWPLEPLQVLMTRVIGAYFTNRDLSCAYHQVPLTEETQKLTSFIVGGRQYTY